MERDVVIVVAPNVARPELQYALRSLDLIPHGRVFMVGGHPEWVVNVNHVPFNHPEKWMALTRVWDLFRTLPLTSEFIYTEDDYFILEPVDDIPNYHQGPLAARIDKTVKRITPSWRGSLKATLDLLHANGIPQPLSFDVHIPMVVEKDRIPNWKSPHVLRYRDLVGNTATRPPVQVARDVKCATAASVRKVEAARVGFLSSSERTFISSGVRDVLKTIHPEPCRYEKEYYMPSFEPESAYDQPVSLRALQMAERKARIVERHVRRNRPVEVKLDDGRVMLESEYESLHAASELAGDLTEEE